MSEEDNMSKTLRDLAGTGRGLGSMTVEQLRALLDSDTPAKVTGREAKVAKRAKARKAKKDDTFYREVIVGQREERMARQSFNREAAAWMRENGLIPQGQAWTAVKDGERGIAMLQALNLADGLTPLVAKGGKAKAKQQAAKPPVVAKKAKKAKAKAAAEPAKPEGEGTVVTLIEALDESIARTRKGRKRAVDADTAVDTREEMIQALVQSGFDRQTAEALVASQA